MWQFLTCLLPLRDLLVRTVNPARRTLIYHAPLFGPNLEKLKLSDQCLFGQMPRMINSILNWFLIVKRTLLYSCPLAKGFLSDLWSLQWNHAVDQSCSCWAMHRLRESIYTRCPLELTLFLFGESQSLKFWNKPFCHPRKESTPTLGCCSHFDWQKNKRLWYFAKQSILQMWIYCGITCRPYLLS